MGQLCDREGWTGGPVGARVTEDLGDFDPSHIAAGLEWVTLDVVEAEAREAEAIAQRLIDLLAWVLREGAAPANLADPTSWPPGIWVTDWPETWDTALRDPVIYDLARHQLSADLVTEPDRYLTPIQESNLLRQAAILLRMDRPSQSGKGRGRRAVEFLIRRLAAWTMEYDPKAQGPIAEAKLAAAISEALTFHPCLSGHPDAVPSADAVRAILRQ